MQEIEELEALFIAGFGPVVRDVAAARRLYRDTLGISFKEENGGYLYTGALNGAKHFALWPALAGGAIVFWP